MDQNGVLGSNQGSGFNEKPDKLDDESSQSNQKSNQSNQRSDEGLEKEPEAASGLVQAKLPFKPKTPLVVGLVLLLVLVGVGGLGVWQRWGGGETPEVFYQGHTAIPDLKVKEVHECEEDIENRTFKICITVENSNQKKVSNFANKVTVQGKDKNGNSVNFTDNIVISKEIDQWHTAGMRLDNNGQLFSWEQIPTGSPTPYVVSIELDTGNAIKEYSEKNNTTKKTLKGYPTPESLGWSCSGKKQCIVASHCEGPGQKYCSNCKCINHVSCSDGDDGRDPKMKGVVTKQNVGWSSGHDQHDRDTCFVMNAYGHAELVQSGGQLREVYCQIEEGKPLKKCDTRNKGSEACEMSRGVVDCETEYGSDYKCSDGACKKISGVVSTPTPTSVPTPASTSMPTSTPIASSAPTPIPSPSGKVKYTFDDFLEVLRNME